MKKIKIAILTALFAILTAFSFPVSANAAEAGTDTTISIYQAYVLKLDFNQIELTLNKLDYTLSGYDIEFYFTDQNGDRIGYLGASMGGGVTVVINYNGMDIVSGYDIGQQLTAGYNAGIDTQIFLDGKYQLFNQGYPQGEEQTITPNITDIVDIEFITVRTSLQAYLNNFNRGYTAGYQQGREDGENAGYLAGYEQGREDGETEGYNNGYEIGYNSGYATAYGEYEDNLILNYNEGYNNGYNVGYTAGLETGNPAKQFWQSAILFITALFDKIIDLLNVEIVPGLINFSMFLIVPLAGLIITTIIGLFTRNKQ